jgi:hypothetical protein
MAATSPPGPVWHDQTSVQALGAADRNPKASEDALPNSLRGADAKTAVHRYCDFRGSLAEGPGGASWTDAVFRERLLRDGKSAAAEMGFGMPEYHGRLVVLEDVIDKVDQDLCFSCFVAIRPKHEISRISLIISPVCPPSRFRYLVTTKR